LKKLLKIVNYKKCQKTILSQLEKVGGHQYPLGSTRESRTALGEDLPSSNSLKPDSIIVSIIAGGEREGVVPGSREFTK
jgi:hypothetical protein